MKEGATGPIAAVLATLPKIQPIVESLDPSALADIEASFEWYGISGGTILFQAGDAGDAAFVLAAGRLAVYLDTGTGSRLTAQIGPGELVGEMALISGEPRSATVIALRDSARLRRSQQPLLPQATKALAFIPVDERPLEPNFTERMQTTFLSLSVRIGLIGSTSSHLSAEAIAAVEEQYDLVLYIGDRRCSAWSSRCLRQADHVVFVSDADYEPDTDTDKRSATRGGFTARPTSCSSIKPTRPRRMERLAGSAASRLIGFSTHVEGTPPTMQEWRG
jgi:NTE family protein